MIVNASFKMPGWCASTVRFTDFDQDQEIQIRWRIPAFFLRMLGKIVDVKTAKGNLYLDKASFEAWKEKHQVKHLKHNDGAWVINQALGAKSIAKAQLSLNANDPHTALQHLKKASEKTNENSQDLITVEMLLLKEEALKEAYEELPHVLNILDRNHNSKFIKTKKLIGKYEKVIADIGKNRKNLAALSQETSAFLTERGFTWLKDDTLEQVLTRFTPESCARKVADICYSRIQEAHLYKNLKSIMVREIYDLAGAEKRETEGPFNAALKLYDDALTGNPPDTVAALEHLKKAEEVDIYVQWWGKICNRKQFATDLAKVLADKQFLSKTKEQFIAEVDKVFALKSQLELRIKGADSRAVYFSELYEHVQNCCTVYSEQIKDKKPKDITTDLFDIGRNVVSLVTGLSSLNFENVALVENMEQLLTRYVLHLFSNGCQTFYDQMDNAVKAYNLDSRAEEELKKEEYEKALQSLMAIEKLAPSKVAKEYASRKLKASSCLAMWAKDLKESTAFFQEQLKRQLEAVQKSVQAIPHKFKEKFKAIYETLITTLAEKVADSWSGCMKEPVKPLCEAVGLTAGYELLVQRQQLKDTVTKNETVLLESTALITELTKDNNVFKAIENGHYINALSDIQKLADKFKNAIGEEFVFLFSWIQKVQRDLSKSELERQVTIAVEDARRYLKDKNKELEEIFSFACLFERHINSLKEPCKNFKELLTIVEKAQRLMILLENQSSARDICFLYLQRDFFNELKRLGLAIPKKS